MKRTRAYGREAVSGERLAALRKDTEAWVAATDGKAMALLGAGGASVALAGIQSTQRAFSSLPTVTGFFFGLVCCLGIMSCISSVCCLWPRVDRKRALRERGIQPLARSPSVFWEIGDLDAELFQVSAVDVTEEVRQRDLLEQTMLITWVAMRKLFFLKLSVVLFLGTLCALFLSVLTSILTP